MCQCTFWFPLFLLFFWFWFVTISLSLPFISLFCFTSSSLSDPRYHCRSNDTRHDQKSIWKVCTLFILYLFYCSVFNVLAPSATYYLLTSSLIPPVPLFPYWYLHALQVEERKRNHSNRPKQWTLGIGWVPIDTLEEITTSLHKSLLYIICIFGWKIFKPKFNVLTRWGSVKVPSYQNHVRTLS